MTGSNLGSVGGGLIKSFMRIQFNHTYNDIISIENLLAAWQEFVRGKRFKPDVVQFERYLMHNLQALHSDLSSGEYQHGNYIPFHISDPKPRQIHKAGVRDRVLHHAIYRILYPLFDRTFIFDSFSCRVDKGTHKARDRFRQYARQISRNNTKTCWVLKCDIKKFFASIDHSILLGILAQYISDLGILLLLENVIDSFSVSPGVGLPLGNLTSQLFCNVYMNEFDQFVKHHLRASHYIRYADDFVLLSRDKEWLNEQTSKISDFLSSRLNLLLHPNKVSIKTFASGVDFLGWTHFPDYRIVRNTTKRRILKRVYEHPTNDTLQSYLGHLEYGNAYGVQKEIKYVYESRKNSI